MKTASCGCFALIGTSDDRAVIWLKVRGDRRWPIRDPIGESDLDGTRVYRGRLDDLDDEQLQTLLTWVAHYRNRSLYDVTRDVADLGYLPILAASVHVGICPGHSQRLVDSALERTRSVVPSIPPGMEAR